ncbi:toxin-antitoxin system YwqK family antitoxin [Psychroserpens sp. SPM9]|uniref:toxin-antitoxin system YwqK family antitoxin n=1 Tax=Psychroserpens sp. SPM9 TaxID=2975598 RepID=UPI0021A36ACF|nr:toxin-antitoxin system YwqK family antitoxin [Psychroserpens sp. SPM9]MDG5492291.1 toxin-antitoxin system YwqK family antitoxin [Psychroserpens sp. SPM9]
MRTYLFIFILTLLALSSFAQQSVNQFDADGKRHGVWRKYFDKTQELRYEGQFNHGKEVGLFKFYTLYKGESVLSATKQFNDTNSKAMVKFLSSKGKLISEGEMDGRHHIGKWIYYHNKSDAVMSTEYYNANGELEGEKLVFYPDGTTAEQANYVNGKLEGKSIWYAKDGKTLKEFTYANNELNGVSKYYDADGNLQAEGAYKNDLRIGVWTYYENNKKSKVMHYKNGKLDGKTIWYAPSGKILKDLHYEKGLLHGECKYYDHLGNIESKGEYIEGVKSGDWSYYKHGKLDKTENHKTTQKQ